jgi:hypothetical protein
VGRDRRGPGRERTDHQPLDDPGLHLEGCVQLVGHSAAPSSPDRSGQVMGPCHSYADRDVLASASAQGNWPGLARPGAEATPAAGPSWGPDRASVHLCFRTAAYVAPMTACWLGWSAAVSRALTRRPGRRRWRWRGSSRRVASQVASAPLPQSVIMWPGLVTGGQVCRIRGSAAGPRGPYVALPAQSP